MFRIIYEFFLTDPPSWVAYAHAAVMFLLMGLTYVQALRRGIGFMVLFLAMTGIFMFDVLGYVPFYVWMRVRERRRAAAGEETRREGSKAARRRSRA